MTSERLQEIMKQQEVDKYISVNLRFIVENCMKQAVNEALEEAADEVDFTEATYVTAQAGSTHEIDKQTILSLKVK